MFVEGFPRPEFESRVKNDSRFKNASFAQSATFDYMMQNILVGQGGDWEFDALAIDTQFLDGDYPRLQRPKQIQVYKAQRPEIARLPIIGLTSLEGSPRIPEGVDIVYSVHQPAILDILHRYIAMRGSRS